MNTYDILLKSSMIPKNTPISEFNLFMAKAEDYTLNPLRNEIFLLSKFTAGKGMSFFTCIGINGARKIAHQTNEYEGSPEPLFDGVEMKDLNSSVPKTCKTVVFRKGQRYEYTVYFDEYCPVPITQMWIDKPLVMLAKVSEVMALRKAFPELNGLYIEEELDKLHDRASMMESKRDKINKSINSGIDELIKKI